MPNESKLAIQVALQADVPALLWGAPGVGKTSWLNALARALGWHCETLIASLRDPADFGGYPVPGLGQGADSEAEIAVRALVGSPVLHFAPPPWARRLAALGDRPALLLLDEISTAPPAVQAALLRVVLDKVVGDTALPANVRVVAAANPPEQAAGGWELSAPLANRFAHFTWELDADEWCAGAVGGFAPPQPIKLPDDWADAAGVQRAQIAAFVRVRRHLLHVTPANESAAGRAWPSPRTWTMASRLLAAAVSVRANKDTRIGLVAACVGEGPAIEYLTWLEEADLPDPETLLANPSAFRLPDRGDRQFAVLGSVAAAVCSRPTQSRFDAGWEVLAAAAKLGAVDVSAPAAAALSQTWTAGGKKLKINPKLVAPFLPLLRATGEL